MKLSDHIVEHLDNQPFMIECSECGADLGVTSREVDEDFDLFIKVEPCQHCLAKAAEEVNDD